MRNYLYRVITDQADGFFAGLVRFVLWLASFGYRVVIFVKEIAYSRGYLKPAELGRPVISVGNITWGGVGKTPCVIFLAGYIKSKGQSPAVLTRGYMTGSGPSDEVEVLRQEIAGLAVGVGANRVQSARKVYAQQPVDVFILDDGFQHRKVKRDLNIVLVDANGPFGNGELIPRGILREPLDALIRADVIILTKTDINPSAAKALEERLKRICSKCPVAWAVHQPRSFVELFSGQDLPLSGLATAKVMSFCGIGDPLHFAETLAKLGIDPKRSFVFDDHHAYSETDIKQIVFEARKAGVEGIVTTAKDAAKIGRFKDIFISENIKCWVLNIQFEITTEKDVVLGRVDHLLGC